MGEETKGRKDRWDAGEQCKYAGEKVRERIWKIFNKIWKGEGFPEEWYIRFKKVAETEPNRSCSFAKSDDTQISEDIRNDNEEYIRLLAKSSDDLFYTVKDFTSPPLPRWPSECEIIQEKINHIHYVPPTPEPYYTSTRREQKPKPYDSKRGKVVYQYRMLAKNFHSSSFNGRDSQFSLINCDGNTLRFESRFENGNLAKAVKISETCYELYLRSDLFTLKQKQWFYFSVANMKKSIQYRFSIVNISKQENLYVEGMKPLMYSKKSANWNSIGWKRCGENITFFQKEGIDDPDKMMTYTLSFTLVFPYNDDTVYFAYSYPYSYTDLQNYLYRICRDPSKSDFTTLRVLCRTLAGNNVYYVTITSRNINPAVATKSVPNNRAGDHSPKKEKRINTKQSIIITARVHPVESPSSWMMKGFLDFLTGDSLVARKLRDRFIFTFIPMLNPDGVIVGNSRCSLTGKDLNEQFRNATKKKFPTVWYTKLIVERAVKRSGVVMFCDLHAQFVMHNMYICSCVNERGIKSSGTQIFPLMLGKNAGDKFSFECCKFTSDRYKECTSHTCMATLGISNSITLDVSYGGSLLSDRVRTHFTIGDYENIAHAFCQTLLDYYNEVVDPELLAARSLNLEDLTFKPSLSHGIPKEGTRKRSKIDYLELSKKTSKELFPIVKKLEILRSKPKWPAECQVLDEKIKHIWYVPPKPEPYYVSSGKELKPKPIGYNRGKVVYEYPSAVLSNFLISKSTTNSIVKGNLIFDPYSLGFESRFESGNLDKAVKINDGYYELYVRNDLYTAKQRQWYYFRVTNMKKCVKYRFSIVNLTREEHLYKQGMRPLMYSERDAMLNNVGWKRCGDNIAYYLNDGSVNRNQINTYTLTFTLDFPYDNDKVYLAYCYPYTYSDLQDYLFEISKKPFVTLRVLCKTLAGNNLYYVVIHSPEHKPRPYYMRYRERSKVKKPKKAIIITARVHPGETPASWMMKGFLDFLTSNNPAARTLREKYIFKLVPMLNPDGVIVGNTRYSLVGNDLNREYKLGHPQKFPTVWFTKLMIQKTFDECGVAMYCDLHSQYALNNIFIYGCTSKTGLEKQPEAQKFLLILKQNAKDLFSLESCRFGDGKFKDGTARITMWNMGISHSFTVEASFGGSSVGDRTQTHFSICDFEEMGRSICQTFLEFFTEDKKENI